jgi:hypothetical protein
MYGDYEDYDELMDDYNDELEDLVDQERDVRDAYEMEIHEIDEYWDREERFIRERGIYTKEEIKQILDEQNAERKRQKEAAREKFLFEKEAVDFDKEQLEFDRQMAEMDMENVMLERDLIRMQQEQEQEMESRIIAARNEELAAYADFIASLDE